MTLSRMWFLMPDVLFWLLISIHCFVLFLIAWWAWIDNKRLEERWKKDDEFYGMCEQIESGNHPLSEFWGFKPNKINRTKALGVNNQSISSINPSMIFPKNHPKNNP